MQETIYIDTVNILRMRWLFEPPSSIDTVQMRVMDVNGDCTLWEGDVPARKCNNDLLVTVVHGCDGEWNSDLGDFKLQFLYLDTLIAARTVKLSMV